MNQIIAQRSEKTDGTTMVEWTSTHSFYADMGGFIIELSSNIGNNTYIPENLHQATLTAQGVLFMMTAGYDLPSISKDTISDRSKADTLAKSLVCLQAAYMIIQCVSRWVNHFPLSLLEVNTLGHVFCAMIMYFFWWNKPQDVNTTSRISDEHIRPLCAYMFMESSLSLAYDGSKREFSRLRHYDESLPQSSWNMPLEPISGIDDDIPATFPIMTSRCTVHEGLVLPGTGIGPASPPPQTMRWEKAEKLGYVHATRTATDKKFLKVYQRPAVHLDTLDVNRWNLAWKFIKDHDLMMSSALNELLDTLIERKHGIEFVDGEIPNWPHGAGLLLKYSNSPWVTISLAVGAYGGLHVGAAWNAHFPTFTEQLMWRISSVLITASGPLAMMFICLKWFFGGGKLQAGKCIPLFTGAVMIFGAMFLLPILVGLLAYVPARIFLVAEAFISLRDMPVEVYQTLYWTQWLLHL